jgi:hypothetical protein
MIPSSDTAYETTAPALVPKSAVEHFRTSPLKKDLFVKYNGFSSTYPFAIGYAFFEADINVHAALDSLVNCTGTKPCDTKIDVVTITNDTVNFYQPGQEHIQKRGVRDWKWPVKGASGIGDGTSYGGNTKTYQKALVSYFEEKPYLDQGPNPPGTSGKLDPISAVEDQDDDGVWDNGEDMTGGTSGSLDRDKYVPGNYAKTLSTFDIDKDSLVELPVFSSYNDSRLSANEYTKKHVLKHTITHELGHAVGISASHTQNASCVMYQYSNNWSRDDKFSDAAKIQIQILNQ